MKKPRRHFPAIEKVAVLKRHLVEKVAVSDLCNELDIAPTLFYGWLKAFFENGHAAFDNGRKTQSVEDAKDKKIEQLEAKLQRKNEVVAEDGIALGQVATEAKSNEITAIPELLKQINLAKSVVTIDAMGCQKEIAQDIVDGGGDFVIAVKDNQPKLRAAVESHFEEHLARGLEDLQYRSH